MPVPAVFVGESAELPPSFDPEARHEIDDDDDDERAQYAEPLAPTVTLVDIEKTGARRSLLPSTPCLVDAALATTCMSAAVFLVLWLGVWAHADAKRDEAWTHEQCVIEDAWIEHINVTTGAWSSTPWWQRATGALAAVTGGRANGDQATNGSALVATTATDVEWCVYFSVRVLSKPALTIGSVASVNDDDAAAAARAHCNDPCASTVRRADDCRLLCAVPALVFGQDAHQTLTSAPACHRRRLGAPSSDIDARVLYWINRTLAPNATDGVCRRAVDCLVPTARGVAANQCTTRATAGGTVAELRRLFDAQLVYLPYNYHAGKRALDSATATQRHSAATLALASLVVVTCTATALCVRRACTLARIVKSAVRARRTRRGREFRDAWHID